MDLGVLLTVLGGVLTIGLTINAFFLKSLLNGQNAMQVEVAKILVKIENFNGRIEELEHNLRKLELQTIECRGRCEASNSSM